jgi:hypothetical protein
MSIPLPLAMRLKTSHQDLHVTADLRDLTFRSVVPGGFASATCSLDRPLIFQPGEIALYGKMFVYDTRHGGTVWEGRLEDPGVTAGDGQIWELSAVGPSAHMRDRTTPIIYVDRSLERWRRTAVPSNEKPGISFSVTDDPGGSGSQAIVLGVPDSFHLANSDSCTVNYEGLLSDGGSNQNLALLDYQWDAGFTNSGWHVRGFSAPTDLVRDQTFTTSGSGFSAAVIGSGAFAVGDNRPFLQLFFQTGGPATTSSDVGWVAFRNVIVRATTYNRSGTEITSGYTSADSTILASTVVADLLGRLLTQFDGANATIDTTSFGIEQLAYPDGVTAEQVIEDLSKFEPGYYAAAWESNAAGKYRFEYKAWPTSIGLEADIVDGFSSPGSADGLYNKVRIRYRGEGGRSKTVQRTQTVQQLTDAGIDREAYLDLGDEVGTTTNNANQAGDQFLAEHAQPPNAGRLTLARPILDLETGRMLSPWEIRPGRLIRVRGVMPTRDSLNATTRDGVTVFRVVGSEFRASSATAELELDSYPVSIARAIATMKKRPDIRRR